jgi:ATP-dependent helicase/nuclease subunit A
MIDEYQDSNLVQEAILTSVSRTSQGEYNMFMVGDVKQSIYRFRLSRPELFMEKFHTYSLEDSEKQRIDLHKNFRSRQEVLDFTNDIFYKIMGKELGNVTYDKDAALYPGAEYVPHSSMKAEVLLYETNPIE